MRAALSVSGDKDLSSLQMAFLRLKIDAVEEMLL
jgi:hypothetical protein